MARSLKLAVSTLLMLLASGPRASAREQTSAAVIVVGQVQPGSVLAAVRRVSAELRWQATVIAASKPPPPARGVNAALTELQRAYVEADFLRCLATAGQPRLAVERLLERGARREAALVQLWTAACAHGADDLDRARSVVALALRQELPLEAALVETRPDFQHLVEAERAAVQRAGRVPLFVTTRPAGAELLVDGRAACRRTPCTVRLLPGEHLLSVEHLGYERRVSRHEVRRGVGRIELSLDAVSAERAREQLQLLVTRGALGAMGSLEVGRLAATATEAQVVVVAWREGGRGHAVLYDQRADRILARASALGEQALESAASAAAQEWLRAQPRPFYKRAWFYVTIAGAVGLTALVTFFATRSAPARHDVIFQ